MSLSPKRSEQQIDSTPAVIEIKPAVVNLSRKRSLAGPLQELPIPDGSKKMKTQNG